MPYLALLEAASSDAAPGEAQRSKPAALMLAATLPATRAPAAPAVAASPPEEKRQRTSEAGLPPTRASEALPLMAMTVEPAHLAVVFDSLARSKTTLVDRSQADERIASWRRDDGSFDVDAFSSGLRKGSVAVLAANAVLYFFLTAGAAVVARVVLGAASGGGSG